LIDGVGPGLGYDGFYSDEPAYVRKLWGLVLLRVAAPPRAGRRRGIAEPQPESSSSTVSALTPGAGRTLWFNSPTAKLSVALAINGELIYVQHEDDPIDGLGPDGEPGYNLLLMQVHGQRLWELVLAATEVGAWGADLFPLVGLEPIP